MGGDLKKVFLKILPDLLFADDHKLFKIFLDDCLFLSSFVFRCKCNDLEMSIGD